MELNEAAIEKEDIRNVKTEIVDLYNLVDTSFLNVTLINSPDKMTKDVLKEFSSNNKPINLITLGKNKWTTTIVNFDIGFLYVNAPSGFQIYIGELVIVQFQSDNYDYVIQTVLHKYTIQKFLAGSAAPVLSLRFLDPRIDKRYQPLATTSLNYKMIDRDVFWLKESNHFIVRNTGYRDEEDKNIIMIKETIGKNCGLKSEGEDDIYYLDKEIGELRNNMQQAVVADISVGGCSITTDNKDIVIGSLMILSTIIDPKEDPKEAKHKFNRFELLLFAIVRNVRPAGGDNYRCGLKFATKIDDEYVHLKRLINPIFTG